jgi:hypothetical protein
MGSARRVSYRARWGSGDADRVSDADGLVGLMGVLARRAPWSTPLYTEGSGLFMGSRSSRVAAVSLLTERGDPFIRAGGRNGELRLRIGGTPGAHPHTFALDLRPPHDELPPREAEALGELIRVALGASSMETSDTGVPGS